MTVTIRFFSVGKSKVMKTVLTIKLVVSWMHWVSQELGDCEQECEVVSHGRGLPSLCVPLPSPGLETATARFQERRGLQLAQEIMSKSSL